jgi:hypothetical protein
MMNAPDTESESWSSRLDRILEEEARRRAAPASQTQPQKKRHLKRYKVTRSHERNFIATEWRSDAFLSMYAPIRKGRFRPKDSSTFSLTASILRCGRHCLGCWEFKPWFNPQTLQANYQRQAKSVTGFMSRCKECVNKTRRRRRVELGVTRRSRKPV